MATRTILGNKIKNGQTFTYSATILQEDGTTPVDLTSANTTVLCSHYRDDNDNALNGRDAQSVITAGVASNNHTGDAAGLLTFKTTTADTTIGGQTADLNIVLRYEVQYQDGAAVARVGIFEVQYTLEPLDTVV